MISASPISDIVNGDLQSTCAIRSFDPEVHLQDFVDHRAHGVAVLVPMTGKDGVFGPSCIASAQLAIAEINARNGIGARKLEPVFLNSDATRVYRLRREIDHLLRNKAVAGVISASSSEVRQELNMVIDSRVPHVFTPPYDGNERTPNVFTIGGTPEEQFVPAIRRISELLHVRRWAMIGKNYVRPHPSGHFAQRAIARFGGSVVHNKYILPGNLDAVGQVEQIAKAKPDVVFISLVGQEAVEFNRVFSEAGLDRKTFRLSETIEENTLLGIGAENTTGMLTVSSYFSTLDADIHLSFLERYHAMHGAEAPAMNMGGQSVYEGIQFYGSLVHHLRSGLKGPIMYRTARGGVFHSNLHKEDPVYLAEADGLQFRVLEELERK